MALALPTTSAALSILPGATSSVCRTGLVPLAPVLAIPPGIYREVVYTRL